MTNISSYWAEYCQVLRSNIETLFRRRPTGHDPRYNTPSKFYQYKLQYMNSGNPNSWNEHKDIIDSSDGRKMEQIRQNALNPPASSNSSSHVDPVGETQRRREEEGRRRQEDEERKKREVKEKRDKRWDKYKKIAQMRQGDITHQSIEDEFQANRKRTGPQKPPTISASSISNQEQDRRQQIRQQMQVKIQAKKIAAAIGNSSHLPVDKLQHLLSKEPALDRKVKEMLKDTSTKPEYIKARLEYLFHCAEIANCMGISSIMGSGKGKDTIFTPIDHDGLMQELLELPDDPLKWTAHFGFQADIKGIFGFADQVTPYTNPKHPAYQASEAAERAHEAYHGTQAHFG